MTTSNPDRSNDNSSTITFKTIADGVDRVSLEKNAIQQARKFFGDNAEVKIASGYTVESRTELMDDSEKKYFATVSVQHTPSIGGLSVDDLTSTALPGEKRPTFPDDEEPGATMPVDSRPEWTDSRYGLTAPDPS